MDSLLQEVARSGTAARAQATLKRPDLYGKTGTTNDSWDAWFAGFQPTITAVTWIGYDTPRNLGSRETGGAQPARVDQLHGKSPQGRSSDGTHSATGRRQRRGEWFYEEYARNAGVASLGMESQGTGGQPSDGPAPEERSRILDLFPQLNRPKRGLAQRHAPGALPPEIEYQPDWAAASLRNCAKKSLPPLVSRQTLPSKR